MKIIVGAGHARDMPHTAITPTTLDCSGRGHGPLLRRGHKALRKGRVSLPHHAYFITTTTLDRQRFFDDFHAGCAAARCFQNTAVLGDANMLAWVLSQTMPIG